MRITGLTRFVLAVFFLFIAGSPAALCANESSWDTSGMVADDTDVLDQDYGQTGGEVTKKISRYTDTKTLVIKQRPISTEEIIILHDAAKKLRKIGEGSLSQELERVLGKLANM